VSDEVDQRLARRSTPNAAGEKVLQDLVARQRSKLSENVADHDDARVTGGFVEAELEPAAPVARVKDRAEHRQKPAHILGRNDVERPAHQPGAHGRAFCREGVGYVLGDKTPASRSHRQSGRRGDLCLHATDGAGNISRAWTQSCLISKVLGGEPRPAYLRSRLVRHHVPV